jgi:hypothetical protein
MLPTHNGIKNLVFHRIWINTDPRFYGGFLFPETHLRKVRKFGYCLAEPNKNTPRELDQGDKIPLTYISQIKFGNTI